VMNIHTRLKGKIKTVRRNGKDIKEFVENESAMKPDDLRALREMSRELDAKDSKFRCVVSVMMLREGWDVRNVTTIIPLRPYSASSGILPEQTLGRGLRRMFRDADIPEMVTVVHHPAFTRLYEEELAQEGLDIAVLPVREVIKQTVTIYPDIEKKPVSELEIELPRISDSVEVSAELQGLTFAEIQQYYQGRYQPLPIGKKKEGVIEYRERHLFTDEIVTLMQLDAGLLTNAWSAASYYARMIARACRLVSPHQALTPLVEEFISKLLFERPVDLFSGEVDHRMRDVDVKEYILATFTPLVMERIVHKTERIRREELQKLSEWKPYQATSTGQRPAVPAQRTLFNLVPCENDFEQTFADFCDFASDVAAFAKNAGPQKLMLDYLRPDGHRALYVPDFFVRLTNGDCLLVELKGKVDQLVPVKALSAMEWCKAAAHKKVKWQYLYVPYHLFQQSGQATMTELVRACEPTLQSLVKEAKTKQPELPLFEDTARKELQDLFSEALKKAGVVKAPAEYENVMRQAIQLLDHIEQKGMPDFSPAFQPLLRPLDDYSIRILEHKLKAYIPADIRARESYFSPYLNSLTFREKNLLEKNQRYIKENLVLGRSIQKLGTLLFCLGYAKEGAAGVSGVWKDVKRVFSTPEAKALYTELQAVNEFRNTRIAHIEARLDNASDAWNAMLLWLHCIEQMANLAM
jgi:type III restriction enzyme